MTDNPQAALLRAFWHRTRKCFVPLTSAELDRKIGPGKSSRQNEIAAGIVRRLPFRDGTCETQIYDLTDRGRALAVRP